MSVASIPVDLLNPGQVFGCLGFLEAAVQLLGPARAAFDWRERSQARFTMSVPGLENGFEAVLRFLEQAEVSSQSPPGATDLVTEKWGVASDLAADAPAVMRQQFPVSLPSSPATLPALLRADGVALSVHHWGDTTRDNVKFWAGSGGYPGAALLRDALDLVRDGLAGAAADPFALSAVQSSSFRFDWRRDYIPLDAGFSLNAHSHIAPLGYPLVEIMAAIGLTNARPRRVERRNKLHYRYSVIGFADSQLDIAASLLPPSLLRAALGGLAESPFPVRSFEMFLGWPGQENQARCINHVIEETIK